MHDNRLGAKVYREKLPVGTSSEEDRVTPHARAETLGTTACTSVGSQGAEKADAILYTIHQERKCSRNYVSATQPRLCDRGEMSQRN